MVNEVTGACKGYGFVLYGSLEETKAAITELNRIGYHASYSKKTVKTKLIDHTDSKSANLYISNLPFTMDENELFELFKPFNVVSVKIMRDSNMNSRRVGFARMNDRESSKSAIDFFYQKSLPGVNGPLKIKFADSQAQKQIRQTEINKNPNQHVAPVPETEANIKQAPDKNSNKSQSSVNKYKNSSNKKKFKSPHNTFSPQQYIYYPSLDLNTNFYMQNYNASQYYQVSPVFIPPRPFSSHTTYGHNGSIALEPFPNSFQPVHPKQKHFYEHINQNFVQYQYTQAQKPSYPYPYNNYLHHSAYPQKSYSYPHSHKENSQKQNELPE
ncbi:hypothetical protein BB561_003338 [Smittium simulii]|uniref:RRM domain-containing protein n=1 Tax=Smittium simulii TaxID=133385 RepID=A0A2T9YM03_9FUNG|nr:hypothetical protein BB561_003338 [Smittium simulii]